MTQFDFKSMQERLDSEMKRQRRSMTELSEAAGLSASYVRNVLKRGQVPTVDKLDAIAQALGVSAGWLMYGVDLPPEASKVFELLEKDPKRFYALLALAEPAVQ